MTGDPAPTMAHLFAAGGSAGFFYWLFFYPLDVIKSAMQTDAQAKKDRRYCGVRDAAKQLYAEGGVARFYKGITPCLLRAIPANAIMLITNVRVGGCAVYACVLCELTPGAAVMTRRRKCAPCWVDEASRAARGRVQPTCDTRPSCSSLPFNNHSRLCPSYYAPRSCSSCAYSSRLKGSFAPPPMRPSAACRCSSRMPTVAICAFNGRTCSSSVHARNTHTQRTKTCLLFGEALAQRGLCKGR